MVRRHGRIQINRDDIPGPGFLAVSACNLRKKSDILICGGGERHVNGPPGAERFSGSRLPLRFPCAEERKEILLATAAFRHALACLGLTRTRGDGRPLSSGTSRIVKMKVLRGCLKGPLSPPGTTLARSRSRPGSGLVASPSSAASSSRRLLSSIRVHGRTRSKQVSTFY